MLGQDKPCSLGVIQRPLKFSRAYHKGCSFNQWDTRATIVRSPCSSTLNDSHILLISFTPCCPRIAVFFSILASLWRVVDVSTLGSHFGYLSVCGASPEIRAQPVRSVMHASTHFFSRLCSRMKHILVFQQTRCLRCPSATLLRKPLIPSI